MLFEYFFYHEFEDRNDAHIEQGFIWTKLAFYIKTNYVILMPEYSGVPLQNDWYVCAGVGDFN